MKILSIKKPFFSSFPLICLSLFASNALAAGCNVTTFSSLSPPGDATDVVVDTAVIVPATPTAQSHCQVQGRMDTASTSVIQWRVLLPPTWNNKLFMTGNGGFAGSLPALNPNDLQALAKNYAISMTDTGHVGGGNPTWALNNPLGQLNYGHRAVHLTALLSKEVVDIYYGQPPQFSYFASCSTGGRQALMEAQRYPDDFDGIYAGAPGLTTTGLMLKYTQTQQAQYPDGNFLNPVVPPSKLGLIQTTVTNMCDAQDGIADGIINDPIDRSKCKFKPKDDLPKCVGDVDGPACFTSKQIDVLETIYSEMKAANHQSYPGFVPGLENVPGGNGSSINIYGLPFLIIPATGTPAHPAGTPAVHMFLAERIFGNFLTFTNLTQPVSYLDFNLKSKQDVSDLLTISAVQDATNPDLSAFKERGGKLIMYHGWHDPSISPLSTIAYYHDVETKMNGKEKTRDFARLFMMPGTIHCSGGPGVWNIVDFMGPLENWVENGIAPDSIIASNPPLGRTRPLCPYPEIAVLNDGLDATNPVVTNNAANFRCEKKGF